MKKKKYIYLFSYPFFRKHRFYIVWNWFIVRVILTAKIFVLRQFKMATNQTESFRLEKSTVIRFLVVERKNV